MKERPILFSGEMVRAILDGRKTKTRRIVKGFAIELLQPNNFTPEYVALPENGFSPYGFAGDRLWVRETWAEFIDTDTIDGQTHELGRDTLYRADGENSRRCTPWRPSIHMPRWASRITLEVTGVRVESLQEISTEDCIAEGMSTTLREHDACIALRDSYRGLWDTLNAARGCGWDTNPWVWVVEFRRLADA